MKYLVLFCVSLSLVFSFNQAEAKKRKKKKSNTPRSLIDKGIGGVLLCNSLSAQQVIGKDKLDKLYSKNDNIFDVGIGVNSLDGKKLIILWPQKGATEKGTIREIEIRRLADVKTQPIMADPLTFATYTTNEFGIGMQKSSVQKYMGKPTEILKDGPWEVLVYKLKVPLDKVDAYLDCPSDNYYARYSFDGNDLVRIQMGMVPTGQIIKPTDAHPKDDEDDEDDEDPGLDTSIGSDQESNSAPTVQDSK